MFAQYENNLCGMANPETGLCSCPSGATYYQFWAYNYFVVTPGNTNYALFMCYSA